MSLALAVVVDQAATAERDHILCGLGWLKDVDRRVASFVMCFIFIFDDAHK